MMYLILIKKIAKSDFHQTVADMAEIPRSQAKTINLGLFYGMGKGKLQAELGVTKEKAAELFNTYHSRVPFVKQLMDKASNRSTRKRTDKYVTGSSLSLPFMGTKFIRDA